jgi:cytochrome c peroxidase
MNANFNNFSDLENLGKNLFMSGRTDCNRCHETSMFSGDRARNNGLDATTTDQGLGAVTGNQNDDGKFKTNSLRNIELTGPYMHDGRFETLEEVIEHYNSGIQAHPNLDNILRGRNNGPVRMNLNQNEKSALVAFLKTLTDYEFINDEKFSDPFVN